MFWRWAKIQTWQLHTSKCIIFTNKQQLNIKHQMQWQGGVHNSVMPREKAVGESFRERVVEVALEQWPQQHTALYNTDFASMPSRHQRQFHVTGTQYISTDKVQSQTLNTGGTAENIFALGKQAQGVFYYIQNCGSCFTAFSAESAQRHSAPVSANTQLRNLFVWCAFAGVV